MSTDSRLHEERDNENGNVRDKQSNHSDCDHAEHNDKSQLPILDYPAAFPNTEHGAGSNSFYHPNSLYYGYDNQTSLNPPPYSSLGVTNPEWANDSGNPEVVPREPARPPPVSTIVTQVPPGNWAWQPASNVTTQPGAGYGPTCTSHQRSQNLPNTSNNQQYGYVGMTMPNPRLAQSVTATVMCPFIGIFAVKQSYKVHKKYQHGDYQGSLKASRRVQYATRAAVVLGLLMWTIIAALCIF